jgi:polar amino acid transport system permease protein
MATLKRSDPERGAGPLPAAQPGPPEFSSASLPTVVMPKVKRRHPGRIVGAIIILLIIALIVRSAANSPKVDWGQVGTYLFNGSILSGVRTTIELTLLCQLIGIVLGVILGLWRVSNNPVLRATATGYSWLFRGTPVLVQLILWFNLGLLFPHLSIGIPFTAVQVSGTTNSLITAFVASVLGLGLNEGAYMMEIVRGGIQSVGTGQTEAAVALGMTPRRALFRIVLPQTLPAVIPPTGNQLIQMLKATSLVAFVAGGDLLTRAQAIYSTNFEVIPLLLVASLWYLAMTLIISLLQRLLERRIGRAYSRTGRKPRGRTTAKDPTVPLDLSNPEAL